MNNRIYMRKAFLAALTGLIVAISAPAAMVDVDGTPLVELPVGGENLPSGTPNNGIADGYDLFNEAIPSSFSTNLLVLGNETASSDPTNFSALGYTSIGNIAYFALVYDLQETNNNEEVSIDNVTISVCIDVSCSSAIDRWSTTDAIVLNFAGTSNLTLKPLGNGADMALFFPVSAFEGFGYTGATQFVLTSTQSDSNNGPDEWTATDEGVIRPGCDGTEGVGNPSYDPSADPDCQAPLPQFGDTDPIVDPNMTPVPEPSAVLLLGAGLLGVAALRRKKRQ